jgi:hypothetical protein
MDQLIYTIDHQRVTWGWCFTFWFWCCLTWVEANIDCQRFTRGWWFTFGVGVASLGWRQTHLIGRDKLHGWIQSLWWMGWSAPSVDALALLLAPLSVSPSTRLFPSPLSPLLPSPSAGQPPKGQGVESVLPCPPSNNGCGNLLLFRIDFSGVGVIFLPIPGCPLSSVVASHCSI